MPLNFPANPSVGQRAFQNGRLYSWNGYGWDIVTSAAISTGSVENFTNVASVVSVNGITGRPTIVAGAGVSISTAASSVVISADGNAYGGQQPIVTTTSDYIISSQDAGKLILVNSAGPAVVYVQPDNEIPTGTHIDIGQIGNGNVSVIGVSWVQVNATPGRRLRDKYSTGTLIKYAADTWLLVGDIAQ